MKKAERISLLLAIALCATALLALLWRVQRGIDYTDEAFYLALPVRIVLGDQPFVDELNIAQTAGLFLVPIMKVYVSLRGTTGIFLFVRLLFLVFFGGVAWAAYPLARSRLPRHAAVLASGVCVTFIPHGLAGLSYNTLGSGFVSIGLFFAARALLSLPDAVPKFHRDRLFWAGLLIGAAAFAYPTLVICAVVAVASTFALASGRRVVSALRMAMGGVTFVLLVTPIFVLAGRRHMAEMIEYSSAGLIPNDVKLRWFMDEAFGKHVEWPLLAITTAVSVALARKSPRVMALTLPFLPLLALGAMVKTTHTSLAFITSLSLIAPAIALALRDSRVARTLIVAVWLPSAFAGAAMGWTSSNGFLAAGAGLFPAAIVSTIMIAMWVQELARAFQTRAIRTVLGFAPAVVLFTMVRVALAPESVYRDAPIPQLTARIEGGPYSGLLTTPQRRDTLARMSADITARATGQRALFYYDFPAGYLIAARRPLTPSSWIFPREKQTAMDAAMFLRQATKGDVVFKLGTPTEMDPKANALDRAVQERSDLAPGSPQGYSVWMVR